MNPTLLLPFAWLLACVADKPDSAADTDTPPIDTAGSTDSTPPTDSATPGWACGEDAPEGVRVLGVEQDMGVYPGYETWLTRVVDSPDEWLAMFTEIEEATGIQKEDIAEPNYATERALVGIFTLNWAWIPFGLYEVIGDPNGVTPVQATWCAVYAYTQFDTSSTTIAAYAIPRDWGDQVESTLITWKDY